MTKSNPHETDRAWLDVDLGAVVRNARRFQQRIAAPLLPMVKANGYGLGAVPVARALKAVDPWGFGVATAAEGIELRGAGIGRPIIVFTPIGPAGHSVLRTYHLTPVIGDLPALGAWLAGGGGDFHVEIDTGMGRAGFQWHDSDAVAGLRHLVQGRTDFQGIFTHFHSADCDPVATRLQAERFRQIVATFPERPKMVHLSSSAGAQYDGIAGGDLARPGIYLYGGAAGSLTPEPVARLETRVVALRELRPGDTVSYGADFRATAPAIAATLAIGYGDGVPRSLSPAGKIELGGALGSIIGRITMDMLMVEVPQVSVAVGDTAVVFGGMVSLDEQARAARTISYELLTMISPRVPRRYQDPT